MTQMPHGPAPSAPENAWEEEVRPLIVAGPVVHGDHAYQLFLAEHDAVAEVQVPAALPAQPARI